MKKRYLFIYIILAFVVSFATTRITGSFVTNYLLPPIDHLFPADPEKQFNFIIDTGYGYFERALAFSFFLFITLITPVISYYKFRTPIVLTVLATILISVSLWLLVTLNIELLLSAPAEAANEYILQLNPLYALISYVNAAIVFLVIFLLSFYLSKKRTSIV